MFMYRARAEPDRRRLRPASVDQSKSPARIPARKADHSFRSNRRIGPSGHFESRTAMPPEIVATSTQAFVSQRLLLRQAGAE
jgi:hypothetical protein